MLRQLIVNADDFGLTPGISRGIIRAHREGIVTSTSVMINYPDAAEWIGVVQQEAPRLGLGLHLTLTAGRPVSPPQDIPELVTPEGAFLHKSELVRRLPTLDMAQVERELRAQVAAFAQAAGHPPDHLDSHHHITYLSPPMAALTIRLARALALPIRRPVPGGPEGHELAVRFIEGIAGDLPSRAYIEELVEILESSTRNAGVQLPDHFIGEFFGERAILGELLLMLLEVPEGVTELMCHPGEVDEALQAVSGYTHKRADELAALVHPSTREVVNSEFIQLISFAEMAR